MARYKESKRDFAHMVSQLTPDEQKEDKVIDNKRNAVDADIEVSETDLEEVSELLVEEQLEEVELAGNAISEQHDMSEITSEQLVSDEDDLVKTASEQDDLEQVDSKKNNDNDRKLDAELSEVGNMNTLEQEIRSSDELRGIGDDTTYITKGTIINGNVESDGDIEILGRVDGNVKCGGKLIVGGRVTGDIETGALYAEVANISGEIRAAGNVKIGAGSVAVGNIFSETAVIAGAVKGDVDIRDSVVIDSTAVIVGNIKSKSVQVNSGAIIDGFCKQEYSEVDVEKYFKNGIENLS